MDDTRLVDLEIKVAYLEKTLTELDDVVREQSQSIELLRREVRRLRDSERGIERPTPGTPRDDKPPHY